MAPLGRILIIIGFAIAAAGVVLWMFEAMPFVGKLPGDIYVRRGNFSFYFPITTCIVVSIILSLLWALMRR